MLYLLLEGSFLLWSLLCFIFAFEVLLVIFQDYGAFMGVNLAEFIGWQVFVILVC